MINMAITKMVLAISHALDQSKRYYYFLSACVLGCLVGGLIVQESPLLLLAGFFLAVRLILFSDPRIAIVMSVVSIFFADWLYALGLFPVEFTWLPDLALIMLTLKVMAKAVAGKRFIRSGIEAPFLVFLIWTLLSMAVNAQSPISMFMSIRQLLKFGFMFFLIIQLEFEESFFRKMSILLFALITIQVPTSLVKAMIYGRGEYAIGTYAYFGGGLSALLPLFVLSMAVGFFFFGKKPNRAVIFLLYFQGFYYACPKRFYPLFAIPLLLYLGVKGGIAHVKRIIPLVPVFLLVIVFLFAFSTELKTAFDNPMNVVNWASRYTYQKDEYQSTGRAAVAEVALDMLRREPVHLAFGFGPGVMTESFEAVEGEMRKKLPIGYGITEFIIMSLEYGLIGVGIFLWMIVKIYRKCNHIHTDLQDHYWKAISFGFLGICVTCFCSFFYTNVFRSDLSAFLFWFIAAVLITISRNREDRKGGDFRHAG